MHNNDKKYKNTYHIYGLFVEWMLCLDSSGFVEWMLERKWTKALGCKNTTDKSGSLDKAVFLLEDSFVSHMFCCSRTLQNPADKCFAHVSLQQNTSEPWGQMFRKWAIQEKFLICVVLQTNKFCCYQKPFACIYPDHPCPFLGPNWQRCSSHPS